MAATDSHIELRYGFAVLDSVGQDPQRQGLRQRDRFASIAAIGQHTRQSRNFGDPAPIGFAFSFDRQHRIALYHAIGQTRYVT